MSDPGRLGPPTCAITFASLPTGAAHIIAPNITDHAAGLLGGYPSLCTAFSMGGVDCLGIDHLDHSKRSGHLRNAKNFGQQKSPQEKDSRERGNERRKLLQSSKCHPGRNSTTTRYAANSADGQWRTRARSIACLCHLRFQEPESHR